MSREEFLCCDAPACSTAEKVGEMELERWTDIKLVVTVDAEGHAETLEGHACSRECVGPAATAIYEAWADE